MPDSPPPRILDVGCGRNKRPGAIGIDRNRDTAADVICDIDGGRLPFRDDAFDEVSLIHVIEHVADVIRTVEEVHRISRAGGRIVIETIATWAMHIKWDPAQRFDDDVARDTAIEFMLRGLLPD